jgi:predicted cupin superfamily sugar epimerase
VVPRHHWQAAESRGEYTLVGCTVGPGFDFSDFTMLRDDSRALRRFRKERPELVRFFGDASVV